MKLDVTVRTDVSRSPRARQLEGMFDVPGAPHQTLTWQAELPIETRDWNVGLIVGPSGAGKSTTAHALFGDAQPLTWQGPSVVDDFDAALNMQQIAEVCQAVGFNTIPAWLRPHSALSNGERFRVEMARRLAEHKPGADNTPLVVDEFTSVVDRQVAQIGSHAVQKYVRRNGTRFVAVTCHYDVIDWLQPDWVFQPATREFTWRSVQPRPRVSVTISPVGYAAWRLFAPFHYLTADLNRTARCWVLFVGDEPAAFAGVMRRPHPVAKNIMGVSRLVTLPDWQGLGLAFVLADYLGSVYGAVGERIHTYPAHPALIRSFDHSPKWTMTQAPGFAAKSSGARRTTTHPNISGKRPKGRAGAMHGPNSDLKEWAHGSRPCAVFRYVGPTVEKREALDVLAGTGGRWAT